MKKYNVYELYWASSERSATTGASGFGVRAYSEGLNTSIIDHIFNDGLLMYTVNTLRRVTYNQIVENPRIVYEYPRIYIYTSINFQGVTKYVVARNVYIGIEHGYFNGDKNSMRDGSNYFAHCMIFDEMPPLSIINYLESNQMFVPVDYTCSPDNKELKYLLTGAPPVLSPKTLEIPSLTEVPEAYHCDYNAGKCIVACLQAYTNKIRQKDEDLCKVIIKSPEKNVLHLIQSLAQINNDLNGLLNFTSNYMNGGGVPLNYNMVFVNEHNTAEIYEHNFVCVDLFSNTHHNIEDNLFYDKILHWANEGDAKTLYKLVNYYLDLDLTKEFNYQFLYNLFIAIESDKDILLQDISQDFLNQLNNIQLSSSKEIILWEKINRTINSGLTSKKGSEINQAINIVGYVLSTNKSKLKITQESSTWITNVIFGENSYLSKIVNEGNLNVITTLVDRNRIFSDYTFYNALKQSQNTIVWERLIKFYYADNLKPNIESVIENILSSNVIRNEKVDLIKRLYPIDKYRNELFSYILNYTHHIPELIEIVKTICLNSREECFSLILKHSNYNPSIAKTLSPIVLSYYGKQIDKDANIGIKNLLSFIDKVSANVFNTMELTELFDKYVKISMENPLNETKKILNTLLSSNIKINPSTSERIVILNNLFDNEIPKQVDINVLFAAHKMNKKADYIKDLYEVWLKTQPTSKDLKEYIKGAEHLSSDMIGGIILSTWESKTRAIHNNRKEYVLIISDNSNWKSRDKKSFIESCRDKDLVCHLTDSDKLIKKIIRKLLNTLKK